MFSMLDLCTNRVAKTMGYQSIDCPTSYAAKTQKYDLKKNHLKYDNEIISELFCCDIMTNKNWL